MLPAIKNIFYATTIINVIVYPITARREILSIIFGFITPVEIRGRA
jgi:hypothetical protein